MRIGTLLSMKCVFTLSLLNKFQAVTRTRLKAERFMLRIMDNECVQIIPAATFWGKFSEVDNWQFCSGDSWVYFFCQDPMNYLQFWWRLGEGEEVSRYFVAAVSLVSWKIESVPISARIRPHGHTLSPAISHTGDSAGINKMSLKTGGVVPTSGNPSKNKWISQQNPAQNC